MRHIVKRVLVLFISVCVLLGTLPYALIDASTINEDKKELNELKSKLENIRTNKSSMLGEIEEIKGNLNAVLAQKQELDIKITFTADEIETVQELQASYQKIISESEAAIVVIEAELESAKKNLSAVLRYLYESDDVSFLELLLSSESLGDLITKIDYAKGMAEYSQTLIESIEKEQLELEKKKTEYTESLETMKEYEKTLAEKKNEYASYSLEIDEVMLQMEEGLSISQEEYAQIMSEESEFLQEIAAMQRQIDEKTAAEAERQKKAAEEKARLEREKKELEESSSKTPSLPEPKSTFAWPLPVSVKYRITSPFGYRTNSPFVSREHHNGVDIAVPSGTNILAVASGTVTRSEYYGAFGNVIVIAHSNGLSSLYCHCKKRLVVLGDVVSAGEVIGLVGTTGQSTGPHLHFAVIENGGYINPEPFLPAKYF